MTQIDHGRFYDGATLLGQEGEILSTGTARFYTDKGRGVFWPNVSAPEDGLIAAGTILETADGLRVRIHKVTRCQSPEPPEPHYNFQFDLPLTAYRA